MLKQQTAFLLEKTVLDISNNTITSDEHTIIFLLRYLSNHNPQQRKMCHTYCIHVLIITPEKGFYPQAVPTIYIVYAWIPKVLARKNRTHLFFKPGMKALECA